MKIKSYILADRSFAEFPKLGGIAVINRTLRPADLAFYPIFSVAVFCGWVFGEENTSISASLRVKHEQGAK